MPMIETSRAAIHYKDYRSNADMHVPYVLIHGAGSQYMDFPSLMRRELGTIALDLPAHGRSPQHGAINIENYAQDVVAFLDALHLEKVILVGHSMGGAIAQQIALDYSEYLEGLILIATGANLEVNSATIEGIVTESIKTATQITKWSWGDDVDENMIQQGVKHLLQTPVEIIQADYIACNNFDVRDRLHEINMNTLIIAGAEDKMTRLAWNEELAERIPHSEIKIFENNGHMVHVEQVEAVVQLIREWSKGD